MITDALCIDLENQLYSLYNFSYDTIFEMDRLKHILNSFEEKYINILNYRLIDLISFPTISKIMNLSIPIVRYSYKKALKMIKDYYTDYESFKLKLAHKDMMLIFNNRRLVNILFRSKIYTIDDLKKLSISEISSIYPLRKKDIKQILDIHYH